MSTLIDILVPIEQEGTTGIVRNWFVKIGDVVAEGDPLLELETDKVAVEVPAPQAGKLVEIVLNADAEAPPGALLGKLDIAATSAEPTPTPVKVEEKPQTAPQVVLNVDGDHRETRHSPAVRRILAEAQISGDEIEGTGKNGRITKADALQFVAQLKNKPQAPKPHTPSAPAPISGSSQKVPHTPMRRSIAQHMSQSLSTAPHVTAVFEADFSAIIKHRNAHKAAYKAQGVNLTFTAYFIAAVVEAMKVAPQINSRWHDDFVEMFAHVNVGIGKLEKRVSVIEVDGHDTIQIRPKAFVSLSIDHRVIDGHQTNSWLTRFVEVIENWPAE
jgi:2-oxoglutarate dehydrogenase E2 component (dihydrolipoamide succinyltransferase)